MTKNQARIWGGVAAIALLGGCATIDTSKTAAVQAEDSYYADAQAKLNEIAAMQPNTGRAKNVILFVGDGMGVSTVTAARIFEGQQRGVDGESNVLAFEAFPYLALSKTYAHDAQVSDSAPTAVAMTTGAKTKNDIISLNQDATLEDCEDSKDKHLTTLWEMAEQAGLATGVITTARLTHATPSAAYAHSASRDWESDADMSEEALAQGCPDIAAQLIDFGYGDGLEIAMGGGRDRFLPATTADPEDEGETGKRNDGRDLTQEWLDRYGDEGAFVWNAEQFAALDSASTKHVLGLFNRSHLEYEADRAKDAGGEPSLAEMTGAAIDMLSEDPDGFLLMVEGGRVDHASHESNAYRTLTDAVALNEAVKTALDKVDTDETLIIVTADHSHTLTINGYPKRGNPILGLARGVDDELILGDDEKPYTTLSFANGPGGVLEGQRADLTEVDTTDPDFLQPSLVPLSSETHAGEDLGIYATGPWAHLFQGTVEENYIFHVMDHASQIGAKAAAATAAPTN
jgi:alkaline phosphatase